MRARYPDRDGYVERDGVKIFFEVFGQGKPTVLLMSRNWLATVSHPPCRPLRYGEMSRVGMSSSESGWSIR